MGSNIILTIANYSIESQRNCYFDGLVVSNTRDFKNHTLGHLCGTKENKTTFTSSRNEMYVKFYSDSSRSGLGFHATYRSEAASE